MLILLLRPREIKDSLWDSERGALRLPTRCQTILICLVSGAVFNNIPHPIIRQRWKHREKGGGISRSALRPYNKDGFILSRLINTKASTTACNECNILRRRTINELCLCTRNECISIPSIGGRPCK